MILENIRRKCKERGVTVAEVEKACGLSSGAICKWNESSPTLSKIKPVADYFACTIDELIAGEEDSA